MRYSEKGPDGPSHQSAGYPINHADNRHWRQRGDVVHAKRRNNIAEEEARHGDILPKMKANNEKQSAL